MIQDKRQKQDASSVEEELLRYRLLVSGGGGRGEDIKCIYLAPKLPLHLIMTQQSSIFLPETIETFRGKKDL